MSDLNPSSSPDQNLTDDDQYFMSDLEAQRDYLQSRRADRWIPFLIPHLKSGMTVLDCGCGQGSITMDVAELVAPGQVTGIDFDPGQVTDATALAKKRGVSNVHFQHGSVYELDFPDETFDVVYAHAVLQHMSERDKALAEMKRVLKATGIVGIADDDFSTLLFSPEDSPAKKGVSLIEGVITHNGGNLRYSRHLRSILLNAGFAEAEMHLVSAESYGTLAETRRLSRIMARLLKSPDFLDVIVGEGWIAEEEIDPLLADVAEWAEQPDSFMGVTYCAAVAWKSPRAHSD